jgi:microcystin-dependent protein
MPMTPTPNRGLPGPALADTADGPDAFDDLRQALDNVAGIQPGLLVDRPPASATAGTSIGSPGTFYWATDTSQLSLSIAGAWIDLSGASAPPIPIGASLEYGGLGDPTDARYLLEDGRELLRAGQYAPLFATLSTRYGAGNGSTTFNIPDSRGRVSVGPDNMGTARGAANRIVTALHGMGNVGGEELHTLTKPEMPLHDHDGDASGGSSSWVILISGTGPGGFSNQAPANNALGGVYAPILHINPNGNDQPHNNMQPYVVKNKIIRVR